MLPANSILCAGDVERNPGPICILQLNCRSLRVPGRDVEWSRIARSHHTNILCLRKTWLQRQDETLRINGFATVITVDREDGSCLGDGVITSARLILSVTKPFLTKIGQTEIDKFAIRL